MITLPPVPKVVSSEPSAVSVAPGLSAARRGRKRWPAPAAPGPGRGGGGGFGGWRPASCRASGVVQRLKVGGGGGKCMAALNRRPSLLRLLLTSNIARRSPCETRSSLWAVPGGPGLRRGGCCFTGRAWPARRGYGSLPREPEKPTRYYMGNGHKCSIHDVLDYDKARVKFGPIC